MTLTCLPCFLCPAQSPFVSLCFLLSVPRSLAQVKEPRVKSFRKQITDAANNKGDTMTKLGAILAAGILDAGGESDTRSDPDPHPEPVPAESQQLASRLLPPLARSLAALAHQPCLRVDLFVAGRNVTISLLSPAGHKKMAAIVGVCS